MNRSSSRFVPPTPHTSPPEYGKPHTSFPTPLSPPYVPSAETLPTYAPAVELFGTCLWKNEYLTPFNESTRRSWDLVVLEVNSTQVNIYQVPSLPRKLRACIIGLFFELNKIGFQQNHLHSDPSSSAAAASSELEDVDDDEDLFYDDAWGNSGEDLANGDSLALRLRAKLWRYRHQTQLNKLDLFYKSHLCDNKLLLEPTLDRSRFRKFKKEYPLKLVGSYTMHQLALGMAPNMHSCKTSENATHNLIDSITHVKYTNTLRTRLETRQALIQCWSFHAMVQWYRALVVGRDLAAPIESRALSKLKSIPTRSNLLLNATILEAHIGARYSEKAVLDSDNAVSNSGRTRAVSTSGGSIATSSSEISSVNSSVDARSIFDEATSMNTLPTNVDDNTNGKSTVTINKMQFVNYENKYTVLEKQYIESCLGELKMFDNWSKKCLTILSVNLFHEFCTPFEDDDSLLFISHNVLDNNVAVLERRMLQAPYKNRMCRSFVVDRSGLISVVRASQDRIRC